MALFCMAVGRLCRHSDPVCRNLCQCQPVWCSAVQPESSKHRVFALPARTVISALRNTPLLVQLFFWYFGISAFLPSPVMQWLNTPHTLDLHFVSLSLPGFER